MPIKKPTDLKSVTLGQIDKLEGKVVVGGGSIESSSTESKGEGDLKKMGGTIEKIEKNPKSKAGSSSGSDSKSWEKDHDKRTEDGRDDGPDGLPDELSR